MGKVLLLLEETELVKEVCRNKYLFHLFKYEMLFPVPNEPNIAVVDKNSTWVKLAWAVEPNGILFRVEADISSHQGHVYNTSNVTGETEFFGLTPYHRYIVRIRAHSGRGAGAFGTRNVSTCAAGMHVLI